MCNQLTTRYSCGHSKSKLTHCSHHDPEDTGAFTTPSTCRRMKARTKERAYVCQDCDERLVREAEEGERSLKSAVREHQKKMKKMKKRCSMM